MRIEKLYEIEDLLREAYSGMVELGMTIPEREKDLREELDKIAHKIILAIVVLQQVQGEIEDFLLKIKGREWLKEFGLD